MLTNQRNPCTGEIIGTVQNMTIEELRISMTSSRKAQGYWKQISFEQRAVHVYKVQEFLKANINRAINVICQSNGKTPQDALITEILPSITACEWYAKHTKKVLKSEKIPNGNILLLNKTNRLEYSPVGVVGIISPWNYPLSIPFGEVIMGLMAGNAIILKVSAESVLVGKFIEECINAGSFPTGLFTHAVMNGSDFSNELLRNSVDKIFFTGSIRIGKLLMKAASETLTPLSLELGGNDPMLVLEDGDIERATNCALWAGLQNAGQSCGGIERIYVHRSIYDEFLKCLIAKCKALRHGPSKVPGEVDIGSITTYNQLKAIEAQVNEALDSGATIVAQSQAVGDCSNGWFYPATILVGCTHSMRIMKEETFGPILPVIPFSTLEEGIALANDCTMALTSSIWGDKSRENSILGLISREWCGYNQ